MVDIFNPEVSQVTKGIEGKLILIYGIIAELLEISINIVVKSGRHRICGIYKYII